MRSTPQIVWQNLSRSDEIEAKIRKHIAKEDKADVERYQI
jgi:hypothetical protein